jgi:hypothetical protein
MSKPLMSKATAVWLVDNTTLSFNQIADFCGMHELEVQGIADGDVAIGVKGFDPVSNNQLDAVEIERGQANALYKLKLKFNQSAVGEEKRRGPRYTPLSKRQDRPAAILWLVKFHPELSDGAVGKLVGTTKPTIQAIRERTHWNISHITPIDPVALGLCKQSELDTAVQAAARKKAAEGVVMSDDERRKLVSTSQSLGMSEDPKMPSGLDAFTRAEDGKKSLPISRMRKASSTCRKTMTTRMKTTTFCDSAAARLQSACCKARIPKGAGFLLAQSPSLAVASLAWCKESHARTRAISIGARLPCLTGLIASPMPSRASPPPASSTGCAQSIPARRPWR